MSVHEGARWPALLTKTTGRFLSLTKAKLMTKIKQRFGLYLVVK